MSLASHLHTLDQVVPSKKTSGEVMGPKEVTDVVDDSLLMGD